MASNDELANKIRANETLTEQDIEQIRNNKELYDIYTKTNEERKKGVDYLSEQLEKLKLQKETEQVIADKTKITLSLREKVVEIAIQELEIEIKKLEKLIQEEKNTEERLKLQEKLVAKVDEQVKKTQELRNLGRAGAQGKVLANLLGIDEANQNSLTYQLFSDPKGVMDGFNQEVQNAGGIAKAFATSVAMKMQEAAVAILALTKQQMTLADQSVSSFYAATGANEAYLESIYNVGRGNTALGIGFAEAGKAMTSLYENLNTFSSLNKSSQETLMVTTAKLERLGISGGETAKSIASLSMMMGKTEEQAAKTVEGFAAMGQAIGVSSKQMISDFNAVKDQLAVFGSTMDKTFTDLAAQSKATGVAVNDLLNLANKFDTFEGAANQVGKLNAMLGGPYLSAMSMIETTDPTERIDMLRQAVNNANMSFESMSYYEKKAIMEAGGFKSVEEAQRVLSMSAGAYAEQLAEQEGNQKTLNDAIERSIPIQEKLQLLMANFAIVIEPVVTGFSWIVSKITEFIDEYPKLGTVLSLILVSFGAMIFILPIAIMIFSQLATIFTAFGAAGPAAAAGAETAAAGIASASATLSAAAPAIATASTALGYFALVLLGLGVAVALVGLGFKLLFEGFAAVLEQAVKAPEVFLFLAAGVIALGAALSALALNPLMWIGMATLTGALFGIAAAFALIDSDKLFNFRVTMEKIVDVSQPTVISGFDNFSEKFEAVAKATANVDASKTQTFTNLLMATQNLSQALKLNQTVIVKIGEKKFEGMIVEVVDKAMGESSTSRAVNI